MTDFLRQGSHNPAVMRHPAGHHDGRHPADAAGHGGYAGGNGFVNPGNDVRPAFSFGDQGNHL